MRNTIISAVVAVLALASAACTITTRSDNYACNQNSDCAAMNRVCTAGWCVVPDCPDICDYCLDQNSVCVIDCLEPGKCPLTVLCPSGTDCNVQCGDGSCTGGVDCRNARECAITCSGSDSCAGQIQCGSERCEVECSGANSCLFGVNCSSSCACVTSCATDTCSPLHSCPGNNCTSNGGCHANTGPCDRC
jgi:hypothetical protein